MSLRCTLFALLLCFLSLPSFAIQKIDANTDETIPVQASADDSNIIGINGGSIDSVWSTEDKVSLDKNEDTGQAIFRPLVKTPFTLFVLSDSGATYTLRVMPKPGLAGQVIVIDEFNSEGSAASRRRALSVVPFKHEVKRWLRSLETADRPAPRLRGFRLNTVNTPVSLWRETRIVHALSWSRSDLRIDRYLVTNVSDAPLRIEEREFRTLARGIRAVALRKLELSPGETTVLYTVRDQP